jgi:hypothetical protein
MLNDALFVSDKIHEKQVKLPDGSEHTLYFKELPAVEFTKFRNANSSDDENIKASSMPKLIAACLCEPDGKAAISLKDAQRLKPAAMNLISVAIMEVNGFASKND